MASPPSSTPSSVDPVVVDLYKLAVEMADRVSARRTAANGFFLTLHAAVITAVGFSRPAISAMSEADHGGFASLMTASAGLALCAAWWLLLRSYRDLNRAKFKVINDLEKQLPAALFADEWKSLKNDEPVRWWRGAYTEQGFVERTVPVVFAVLYLVAIVAVVTGL